MNQSPFSNEKLHKLTVYRRLLFVTFLVIIPSLLVLLWFIGNRFQIEAILGLTAFVGFLLPPFLFIYCLSKYKEAVRKTAYRLISEHFNYHPFNWNSKRIVPLEDHLKAFGLLPTNGYVKYHDHFYGEKDENVFSLADISWMVIQGKTHAYSTKAQYTVLSITPKKPLGCNLLIKKNKLLKWGVKKLKRFELQDKNFEKIYDVYTDRPEIAGVLLNPAFMHALLRYAQGRKKQAELIITPQQIFVLYNTGIWKKLFSLVIFRSPRVQCDKIWKEINDVLDILPTLSLLENPPA